MVPQWSHFYVNRMDPTLKKWGAVFFLFILDLFNVISTRNIKFSGGILGSTGLLAMVLLEMCMIPFKKKLNCFSKRFHRGAILASLFSPLLKDLRRNYLELPQD